MAVLPAAFPVDDFTAEPAALLLALTVAAAELVYINIEVKY